MGTLGKALGASGGFICGRRVLVDYLVNRARSFIFSTAPVPARGGGRPGRNSNCPIPEGEDRRAQLRRRISQFNAANGQRSAAIPTAILPLLLGAEAAASAAASRLRERNVFVPSIRYPTVARGAARLRITLTAAHSEEDVAALIHALQFIGLCPAAGGRQQP